MDGKKTHRLTGGFFLGRAVLDRGYLSRLVLPLGVQSRWNKSQNHDAIPITAAIKPTQSVTNQSWMPVNSRPCNHVHSSCNASGSRCTVSRMTARSTSPKMGLESPDLGDEWIVQIAIDSGRGGYKG